MLRILLANFIVQVLPLLMILAAITLIIKARKGGPHSPMKHYVGISLAAIPCGIIAYVASGIVAARIRGEGHFYSVPFGGFSIDNTPTGLSLLFWVLLVFAVLAFALRPRRRVRRSGILCL